MRKNKQYTGFLLIFLATIFFLNLSLPSIVAKGFGRTIQAEQGGISLFVDGKSIDTEPIMYNGTAYVPIRAAAEALHADISWQGDQASIHITTQRLGQKIKDPPLRARVLETDLAIPVLMYHHIDEFWQEKPGVITSPTVFREHIQTLSEAAYQAVHFSDLEAFTKKQTPLPEKPIIITFDDGYESNYTLAYPILKEFDYKATINIIGATTCLTPGDYPHFSWQEAKKMQDTGIIELGSHTWDMHDNGLVKQAAETMDAFMDRLALDTSQCQQAFKEHQLDKARVFSYPYGKYSPATQRSIEEAGYLYQLTIKPGLITKDTKSNEIPRLTVSGDMSGTDLLEMIDYYKK